MKLLRLILSIVLIAVALWVIIAEQMAGASANAFVNAPVVTIRANTAGDLSLPESKASLRQRSSDLRRTSKAPVPCATA